jgi:hypothetical protein
MRKVSNTTKTLRNAFVLCGGKGGSVASVKVFGVVPKNFMEIRGEEFPP